MRGSNLKEYNQSQAHRDAVSKSNAKRVWTDDMRAKVSESVKKSLYNRKKERVA